MLGPNPTHIGDVMEAPDRRPGLRKLAAQIQAKNPTWSQSRVITEAKSQYMRQFIQRMALPK